MIVASNLCKRYPGGYEAVKDVSFAIDAGQMFLITGHSGAGKSTLVKLIAAIERPTTGSLVVNGQNLSALRRSAIPYLRRHFGMVFQDQKLLFDRSALDNVMLPLQIVGLPRREAIRRAQAALDKVGLLAREKARPIALSDNMERSMPAAFSAPSIAAVRLDHATSSPSLTLPGPPAPSPSSWLLWASRRRARHPVPPPSTPIR